MRFQAHQYQLDAAKFLLTRQNAALFADMGTGKTAILLMVIKTLKDRGQLNGPVLVTSPLRIASIVWPEEIDKWDQFQGITYRLLHGRRKAELAQEPADIHLINNEGLRWAHDTGILNNYNTLVIDELSKYKNWSSGRTKILKQHLSHLTRRYGLTGTPTPKSMMDLFSEMYLVDGGQSLGRFITHYRSRYFVDKGYGYPDWQIRPGAEDEIYERVAPYCYRLDCQDVLDMPPLLCNDIRVDIPDKYRRLSVESLVSLDINVPLNGAGAYMASRRYAGGVVGGQVVHTAKIDALKDIVESLNGRPALVGYYYRDEGDLIRKTFKCPLIDGRTSAKESASIIKKWNASQLPVLAGQPAAMGHGLNLQKGGTDVIWYSLTDNQDDYTQMIARIYRQGVAGAVRVHRLIARGTVDVAIAKSLESKTNQQKALLEAIKELTK